MTDKQNEVVLKCLISGITAPNNVLLKFHSEKLENQLKKHLMVQNDLDVIV